MRKLQGLLLLVLLLAGCATQFVYNRLDWLLTTYLEYTLALDTQQTTVLRQTLPVALSTHRREQLPRYQTWLTQVRQDISQGLTAPQIDYHYQTVQTYWQTAVGLLAEPVAATLQTASDAQIAQFLDWLRDAKVENTQAQERPVRRVKRQLKPWLGSFTPEQQRLFARHNAHFNALHDFYVQSDAQWQMALRQALETRQQPDFRVRFARLLARPDLALTPAQQQELAASEALVKTLLLELALTLTPQQQDYLLEQLQQWADDFAELSRTQA